MISFNRSRKTDAGWLSVTAPARLHLGFVDLNGGLGRRFGSLGLALEQPDTHIVMRLAARASASGPDSERALQYACALLTQFKQTAGIEIMVERVIPAHSGLGSGTQLALAVGSGIARLLELPLTSGEIAQRLARGARSGIGIGAFDQGGFLVDGGRGAATGVPPLITRLAFPAGWRVLLIFDERQQGVHGDAEHRAFAELPEFSEQQAGELSRLLLMQVLPALAEADIEPFGAAISRIQQYIGSYFAPLQGGSRFTSAAVAEVLEWLTRHGAHGVGQSSWGPTGFAFIADEDQGRKLLHAARKNWRSVSYLRFELGKPRNSPAAIATVPATVAISRVGENV
jgi:beta-RFAP synthase